MYCQICGNEGPATGSCCPFCGAAADKESAGRKPKRFAHRTVNLEAGRPVVEVAMVRCREAVDDALLNHISILTLIHGYGSSGKGGAIKAECRKMLEYLKSKRIIGDYIAGEEFHKKAGKVKMLLQRYPDLSKNSHLNQSNQGITLVVLSLALLVCQVLASLSIFKATYLS